MVLYMRHTVDIVISLMAIKLHVDFNILPTFIACHTPWYSSIIGTERVPMRHICMLTLQTYLL